MKKVKVFGPGCKRCETLAGMVEEAAARLGREVEVEKVTDYAEIAMAGVVSTPGLSVDGRLVHAGGLPDQGDVDAWIGA